MKGILGVYYYKHDPTSSPDAPPLVQIKSEKNLESKTWCCTGGVARVRDICEANAVVALDGTPEETEGALVA